MKICGEGENIITIKVTMPAEDEEAEDEVITYTIRVNKEVTPSIIGKIKNWFKGMAGTVKSWTNTKQYRIVIESLILCSGGAIVGGLVVYLTTDYKKYKLAISKVAELSKVNNSETYAQTETNSVVQENLNTSNAVEEIEEEKTKPRGRHF